MIPTLLDHGMVAVGLPYAFQGLSRTDEITGGSPYGASTITKPDGSRMPSENELAGARFQGRHVAQIAAKLKTRSQRGAYFPPTASPVLPQIISWKR
jgi:NAD(P)H dehydrogenase (quinone)